MIEQTTEYEIHIEVVQYGEPAWIIPAGGRGYATEAEAQHMRGGYGSYRTRVVRVDTTRTVING